MEEVVTPLDSDARTRYIGRRTKERMYRGGVRGFRSLVSVADD